MTGALRSHDGASAAGGSGRAPFGKPRWPRAYAFALVTGAMFLFAWLGQFVFQLMAVRSEAQQHGAPFTWGEFLPQFVASASHGRTTP